MYIYTYKYIHTHICTCIFLLHIPYYSCIFLYIYDRHRQLFHSQRSLWQSWEWDEGGRPPRQNKVNLASISLTTSWTSCTPRGMLLMAAVVYVHTQFHVYMQTHFHVYMQTYTRKHIHKVNLASVSRTKLWQFFYNIVPTVSCAESVAVFLWVLHHLQGSLDWLEEDLSVCPASLFKVICALSLLHFVRIQLRLLTKAVVYVHTHFHVCMQTYSRSCVCGGCSVAIHTNMCTCVHGCMYVCIHVRWLQWLRETLENTLTHLHTHTRTLVKELETQKISSVRTHKCTLPRKNMLHTRRNSSSSEWRWGGGWVERSWVWELMVCEEVVWSEEVVWFQTCQRFGQIQKTCIPGTCYLFGERKTLFVLHIRTYLWFGITLFEKFTETNFSRKRISVNMWALN